MTRWEAQQQQAKREGFKNAWAMRKAAASKQRAAERALYGKLPHPWKQQQQASMDSCASQKASGDCEQGNQARRVEQRPTRGEGSHFNIGENGEAQPVHSRSLNHWKPGYAGSFGRDYAIRNDPEAWDRRFDGNGPVRQLMRDGEWLVPEAERPQLSAPTPSPLANVNWRANPIESVAQNAQAPVPPHSQQTKPELSPRYQRRALD